MQWLERFELTAGGLADPRAYYRLVIFGALGENERVTELLAAANNWWNFESMTPQAVGLDPIRDNPAFQELIRPKG